MASLGIYKPGQGYWTRVLTAVGAGVLALAVAQWVWEQFAGVQLGVETKYVQGAAAGLVLAITGGLVYWMVGLNPRINEFFIATEGEMRKVNWSSRREIVGSTWVVVGVSVIIALILLTADIVFAYIFRAAGVLQGG